MSVSALTAEIATRPAYAQDVTTTPGTYLAACRRRAGLSREKCAEAIALSTVDRQRACHDLGCLENDEPGNYAQLVRHLRDRAVFSFDYGTFCQLAAATCAPELDELEAA